MTNFSAYANDNGKKTILRDSHRQALVLKLQEYQCRIEYLATHLDGLEQESLSLRSAAEIIEYVVARLTSKESGGGISNFGTIDGGPT
jgi:hypothetical protein